MPFNIIRDDIQKINVDVIISPSYTESHMENVYDVYTRSLQSAVEESYESIALPLISGGAYGQSNIEVTHLVTKAIEDFLKEHELDIYLVVQEESDFQVSEESVYKVTDYLNHHYVDVDSYESKQYTWNREINYRALDEFAKKGVHTESSRDDFNHERWLPKKLEYDFKDLFDNLENLDESFSETLFRLIDKKGKTDVEVYKAANIDRRVFSKIRSGNGYMPSKKTALALAIALELSLEETDKLLGRAGFSLTRNQKFDVIVEYFITKGIYDIIEINKVLFIEDQRLLGS